MATTQDVVRDYLDLRERVEHQQAVVIDAIEQCDDLDMIGHLAAAFERTADAIFAEIKSVLENWRPVGRPH